MNLRDVCGRRVRGSLCALLCAAALPAAAAPALPDAVRRVFERGAADGAYDTVAVGLIDGTEQARWAFGVPVADDAEFEIGALSDVFTGALFAQAVLDDKVRLAQPLGELIAAANADAATASIPLVALSTQQSGLPATPVNLFLARAQDPYAGYAEADLMSWLANAAAASPAPPGSYSVLNAALLAVALGSAYAAPYAQVLKIKVLAPLGLAHTSFGDGAALLSGHAFGKPAAHWHFSALAGAGGLRSTLGDLLTLLQANLTPERSPLRAALLLARQARRSTPTGAIGLGWNVDEVPSNGQTWPVVWRASETGGFSAFMGFRTDRQEAVVILANAAAELAPIGLAWLTDKTIPAAPSAPYRIDAGQLQRYAGLYRLLDGSELTVSVDDGYLGAQLRGQPPWARMEPIADDVFAFPGGALDITFVRNIDVISGVLLHIDGRFINGRRLSAQAPRLERPLLPVAAAALADFSGDYALDADGMLRVTAQGGMLVLQFTGMAPLRMHAYAADRFASADGRNTIAFERDDSRRVSGATLDLAGSERHVTPLRWRPAQQGAAAPAAVKP